MNFYDSVVPSEAEEPFVWPEGAPLFSRFLRKGGDFDSEIKIPALSSQKLEGRGLCTLGEVQR